MAIIITEIKTELESPKEEAVKKALSMIKLGKSEVKSAEIYKTSVDARHKVCFVNSVIVELQSPEKEAKFAEKFPNVRLLENKLPEIKRGSEKLNGKICVAGFGPAGMFCALTLCENGYKPVVFERGASMDERVAAVEGFWRGKSLSEQTNVQFGEGGAGTFSDGKLTTRINDPLCAEILKKFAAFGAPEEILTKAKPHVGTDKIRGVVKNIRKKIIELGGEVRFLSPVDDIILSGKKVISIKSNGEETPCGALALCIGHSAHDTFSVLLKKGILIEPKAFSVGARIEHLQEDINAALYKKQAGHPALPPAEYALSYREGERAVYTFCMCPGGVVVNSASGKNTIVTNGMSDFSRSGKNANSAVLVSVSPEDFGKAPLSGVEFIKRLEEKAYALGKGRAPAMLTREFLSGKSAFSLGRVSPTLLPGVEAADLRELFPEYISEYLTRGITQFEKKIKGFSDSDSVLTAVESRTSSPVRITRNEAGACEAAENLYPCGEGAGYAGGIMSAAADGIKTAMKIMERYKA